MVIRSLFTGISSLQTHETRLDSISNNIANVNTTGFKNVRVRFEDMFSQTTRIATAPASDRGGQNPRQVGLGQGISSMSRDMSQGAIEVTNRNTDLAIQGDGFFIVKNGVDPAEHYMRAGNFELDRDGNLVNPSNGFRLQGWNAERSAITNKFIVDNTKPIEDLKIELGRVLEAQATSEIEMRGNLNASQDLAIDPIIVKFTKNGVTDEVRITFEHMSPDKPYYLWKAWQKNASTGEWEQATHKSDGLVGANVAIQGIIKLDESGKVVGNWINTDGMGEGSVNGVFDHTDEIPDFTSTTDFLNDYGNSLGLTTGPNGANDYFTIGLTKDAQGNTVTDPSNITVSLEEVSKITGPVITVPDQPPSETWTTDNMPTQTQATETITINGPGAGVVSHSVTIDPTGDPVTDSQSVELPTPLIGADGGPGVRGVDDDGINGVDDFGEVGFAGSDDFRATAVIGEAIAAGPTTFTLANFPISNTTLNGIGSTGNELLTLTDPDGVLFLNEVSSAAAVVAAGDFFVDYGSGTVTVGAAPNGNETADYTYLANPPGSSNFSDDGDNSIDEAPGEVGLKGTDDFTDQNLVAGDISMTDDPVNGTGTGDATNSYVRTTKLTTAGGTTYTTFVGGLFNSPFGGGSHLDAIQLRNRNIIPDANDPERFNVTLTINGVQWDQVDPPGTSATAGFTRTGNGIPRQFYVDPAKGELILNQDIPLYADTAGTTNTSISVSYTFGNGGTSSANPAGSGPPVKFTKEIGQEIVSQNEILDSPDLNTPGAPAQDLVILDHGNLIDTSTTTTPSYDANIFIDGFSYQQVTATTQLDGANRQFFISDPGGIMLIGDKDKNSTADTQINPAAAADDGGGNMDLNAGRIFNESAGGGTNGRDGMVVVFPRNSRAADGTSNLEQRQLAISHTDSDLYDIRVFVNGIEYTQVESSTNLTSGGGNRFKVTSRSALTADIDGDAVAENLTANDRNQGAALLAFSDDIPANALIQVTYSLAAQATISRDVPSGLQPVASYEYEIDPGRWSAVSIIDAEEGEFALQDNRGGTWVNNAAFPTNFPQLGDGFDIKLANYAYDGRVDIIIPNGVIDGTGDTEEENLTFTPNTTNATPNRTDSGAPVSTTLKDIPDYQHATTIEVYDSLGVAHNLKISFERISQNKWIVSVPDPTDPSTTNPRLAGWGIVTFDKDGLYDPANTVIFESPADPNTNDGNPATVGFKGIYFDPPDAGATAGGAPPTDAGASAVKIEMNQKFFEGIIQNEGQSDAQVFSQDGFQAGRLNSFSFNEQGFIVGLYSNGHSQDLGRVALAVFNNSAGLFSEGQNMFLETSNSGQPRIGIPGNDGRGSIVPGALENSNVDLSFEFVDLIITQRGFQANSRVIRTADQVLQEILTLRQ